jgi:putative ABC transport system permease protein
MPHEIEKNILAVERNANWTLHNLSDNLQPKSPSPSVQDDMRTTLTLTEFAWKNVWRRRMRTCLTLCGIGMGIGAFVALVGFSRSFEHEWLKLYESSGTDLAVVQKTFMNTTVNESDGAKLATLPEVSAVSPMILNMMDVTPEVNALVYGWRADSFEFAPLTIVQGRRFRDDQQEVMLGQLLADSLGKKAGDTMDIQGMPFTVAGVYHGGSALEAGALIMPIGPLQKLASLEGKVTAFHVQLRPAAPGQTADDRLHKAEAAIEAALPGLRAVPAAERASNNQLVVLAHAVAWGTSIIALLMGALGIANTMAMSVFERTGELGVLRALGWRGTRVMSLVLIEAAALGVGGGLLGIAGGWALLRLLASLPKTASIVSSSLPLSTLADALVVAVLVGLLAGILPAWRAARLSPVEAMRHE